MMSVDLDWSDVRRRSPKVQATVREALVEGLVAAAEHILQESRRLVPHQDGDLERSGYTTVDIDSLVAAVVYDTPYAVRQHEEMDYAHDAGRQAKYLEIPMNAEASTVRDLLAKAIREAIT